LNTVEKYDRDLQIAHNEAFEAANLFCWRLGIAMLQIRAKAKSFVIRCNYVKLKGGKEMRYYPPKVNV